MSGTLALVSAAILLAGAAAARFVYDYYRFHYLQWEEDMKVVRRKRRRILERKIRMIERKKQFEERAREFSAQRAKWITQTNQE